LIKETNRLAAALADGQHLRFLDAGDRMLEADGGISPEVMGDFLHPTETGYDRLGQAIEPTLTALLAH
jgi:hypothetical protein